MEDVRIDADGEFRCWKCGGKNFREKRTFRAKAIGVSAGVLATPLAAAGILATKKKLYCLGCGEYNQVGNAQPITTNQQTSASQVAVSREVAKSEFEMAMGGQANLHIDGVSASVTIAATDGLILIERPDSKDVKRAGLSPGIDKIPFSYVLGAIGKSPSRKVGYVQILVHGKSMTPHANGSELRDPNTIQFESSQTTGYMALLAIIESLGRLNNSKTIN